MCRLVALRCQRRELDEPYLSTTAWAGRNGVKILLSSEEVQSGVTRLASEIRGHYGRQPLTVLGVMTGSLLLVADLVRQLSMPLQIGVVQASSYRSGMQRGELRLNEDFLPTI